MNKNNKNTKIKKAPDFQEYLSKQLKNPRFKTAYDKYGRQLEIAYQILRIRKQKGLSQAELAKRLGTQQNNITRIEAGQQNFTMGTLQKIAAVFEHDLRVEFVEKS